MDKYNIITIGGAVQDIIFYTKEGTVLENPENNPLIKDYICFESGAKIYVKDVSFFTGGGALNTGAGFSKLGIKTGAITRIGDDQNGKRLLDIMKEKGISNQFVQKDKDHVTGFSFIPSLTSDKVHNIFTYHGAVDYLEFPKDQKQEIKTDWFYISSLSSLKWHKIIEEVIDLKNKINANIAWNPSNVQIKKDYHKLKSFLKKIKVLILNEDEAKELLSHEININGLNINSVLKELFQLGPDIIAITCGKAGAYAYNGDNIYFQKSNDIDIKNTTGAGDAFSSGFVGSLSLDINNIKRALLWGTLESESVIQLDGAQNGLLTKEQIQKKENKR